MKEEEYKALLELLGDDVAFVSASPDRKLCLSMNDVFILAADSESFTLDQTPELLRIYKEKGYDGLVEWVRIKRWKKEEK